MKQIAFVALVLLVCVALTGCTYLRPPDRYQPSQMYGDGGKTPCMGACGPCIHQPKQWLKPCQ